MGLTKQEQAILDNIMNHSDYKSTHSESGSTHPPFPTTSLYQITVQGYNNIWIKDESHNPTGTHKDRLARGIIQIYHNLLLAKKRKQNNNELVHMSLISSGSAAIAIQTMLNRYQLPHLKVLMDNSIDYVYRDTLQGLGAEIFFTDLSKRELTAQDILEHTNNLHGFDITSGYKLDPTHRYYDWLSFEILNHNPDYVLLPYGSGTLYENIIKTLRGEITATNGCDSRFDGDINHLSQTHFLGATSNNAHTIAQKLYSPFLPFNSFIQQSLDFYKTSGFCGNQSRVYCVHEQWLQRAVDMAHEQGVTCEPSGIAGLALLMQRQDHIPSNAKILIVNTGKTKT